MKAKVIIGIIVIVIIGAGVFVSRFAATNTQTQTVPESSQTQAAAKNTVTIANFAFSPAALTIKSGESVTWTNRDTPAHSATADDNSFDTGLLNSGESKSITFRKPGTFTYHCSVHPMMTGKIIVQ